MKTTISDQAAVELFARLEAENRTFAARYPGETGDRQPVHTVYGGAHLFKFDTAARLGERALANFEEYAPDPIALAAALDLPGELAFDIHARIAAKLDSEPVEDFRLDFEDGYGHRADEEEDACAVSSAEQVARGMAEGTLPPFIGIRIKNLGNELAHRALRTLDLFLTRLLEVTGGKLPSGFVVTLPKVVNVAQVEGLVAAFEAIEAATDLPTGALRLELMVETPQSIVDPEGRFALPAQVRAAKGRCVGAHFGVYDYTSSCSITADHQRMRHPTCDLARQLMIVALAGSGVTRSDGATNVLPVPVHRAEPGKFLSALQVERNRVQIHRAWKLHYDDVRHSLTTGFYQGWDLHPAQLPTRYAALYTFFREGLTVATERLHNFIAVASRATLVGDVFDDAATGQALLNFFLRGLNCGAIREEESLQTGLTRAELQSRSFLAILEGRRKRPD